MFGALYKSLTRRKKGPNPLLKLPFASSLHNAKTDYYGEVRVNTIARL